MNSTDTQAVNTSDDDIFASAPDDGEDAFDSIYGKLFTPDVQEAIEDAIGEVTDWLPVEAPTQTKQYGMEVLNNAKLDKDYERLLRMTQVVSKFASTLTLRNIDVNISTDPGMSAPAWSDSESITFNAYQIKRLDTKETVTAVKGLSLHEICHILLTPRDGTVLVKNVRAGKLFQAFNALEDMRIEMFITSRYSNVSEWLTATIIQFLLDNPSQMQYQFPLVYGRKYLPEELRIMVRDKYDKQTDVPELSRLIDEYLVMNLADPSNYKRALEVITEYDKLVSGLNEEEPYRKGWASVRDPNGHSDRKNAEWKPTNGKALNKAQQEAIVKQINIDNGSEYDEQAPKGERTESYSPMAGPGGQGTPTTVLTKMLEEIYDRKQYEIEDAIKQYNGDSVLQAKELKAPERGQYTLLHPVDPKAVQVSRSFGSELEQLRGDYDPAWDRRVEAGRLNVQRYVTGCDVEEAFDQWEIGRDDAVDIECVVLLDTSGSMHWCLDSAYQSMWAIKRALDKINASTTVVTFSDKAQLLYSSDERAGIKMKYDGSGGGTDASDAVKYAHSVLANSTRAIKLAITITDGVWWDSKNTDNMLRSLRKSGVLTALAYVVDPEDLSDGQVVKVDSHGCEVAANITDSRDLFTLARKLVKVGVARNLA